MACVLGIGEGESEVHLLLSVSSLRGGGLAGHSGAEKWLEVEEVESRFQREPKELEASEDGRWSLLSLLHRS